MKPIRKQIVTDEQNRPIAVQVAYQDWLDIERALGAATNGAPHQPIGQFAGKLRLGVDPLEYQRSIRGDWD